jgi:hypothetical protein
MSFTVSNKSMSKCGKYLFSIFTHTLSMENLDKYILDIMYDESKLNYLFQKDIPCTKKMRILQLCRFVDNEFINRESEVDEREIKKIIKDNADLQSYYTFFAEALLARLNIDYVDTELVSGVISVKENAKKVSTGADVCMFSDANLVMGEAKFYGKLYGGTYNIIKDNSFNSKLEDYIKNLLSSDTEIILKGITGDICEKTSDEIKKLPLILSGFVLHTQEEDKYYTKSYNTVDKIKIAGFPDNYKIHLYHLPVESKEQLIYKAQRTALDLIIKLRAS